MPRTLLCCAALAVVRSPLPGRRDDRSTPETLIRLTVPPAAGPQAGPPIPAPARAQGDESRQPDPELLEVFHGAAEILLRQGGVSNAARSCWPCRSRSCPRGAAGLRRVRAEQADWAARLDNPDWQILLKLKADGDLPAAPRRAGAPPPGQCSQGAIPSRGRPGPLRRRPPDRQDDVRHGAPPGRAPDVHRQPGGHSRSRTRPSAPWRRCWSSRAAPTFTGR